MKKLLLSNAFMLLLIMNSYAQVTISTGGLDVEVSKYGRIRLYTPDGTKQLERASILVGTTPTTVFDYQNDATTLETPIIVSNPVKSDFEIYGSFDNTSGGPPDVIAKLNAYGWTNGAYTVVKFNVKNSAAAAVEASIGLDIIPYLGEVYGNDSVSYNSTKAVIRFHRGNTENMGMKLLSASLSSLYSFEWYDGYSVDTSYWNWMHYGSLQPLYASNTADGPVAITSQAPVSLAAGASVDVYYALALGTDEQTMLANIALAEAKYQGMITSVDDNKLALTGFDLGQNYPNPFKNSTSIRYNLPEDGFVTLKIFNVVGSEVATVVNSNQQSGSHTINLNAKDLSCGMYYYQLMFNDQVKTNKMFLIK
ncbi:MAG: T9SS type A sorting domain-containing protein [Bacteroidetes bacterium]|nr:T9SS type A sorting domain-containing protein [Bacteroidota bacterium]